MDKNGFVAYNNTDKCYELTILERTPQADGTFSDALSHSASYAFIGKPFDKELLKHNIECAIHRSEIENEKLNLAHAFAK